MNVVVVVLADHEQSINRYMKLPKKKLTDQARAEANEDLFVYRKKCHKVRHSTSLVVCNNKNYNNSEVLLGTIIHRPDASLASQERKRVRIIGR